MLKPPAGNYQIGKTRITISSLASILTTLKVYRTTIQNPDNVPRPVIATKNSTILCSGQSVKLVARPDPVKKLLNYQWYKNNQPIIGATGKIFIANATGFYYVYATSEAGCSNVSMPA